MRLKLAVPMLMLLLLCACGAANTSAQTPVGFRTCLKESGGCTFRVCITADYGDYVRQYVLDCDCSVDRCDMTVIEPEVASGVTAAVSGDDGEISFEDMILAVEKLSSRKLSPLVAPYLSMQAWSQGYMTANGTDGELETTEYALGYGSGEVTVVTYFLQGNPVRTEITDGGYTVLSCEISDFMLK